MEFRWFLAQMPFLRSCENAPAVSRSRWMKRAYSFWLIVLVLSDVRSSADAIDQYIEGEMSRRQIPGLALAVLQSTNVLKLCGYGVADLQRSNAVNAETVFEIGSITKQFTAALILMLVEDGKPRLDDPISKYLPGTPAHWAPITVRHLLTHTSGIPSYTRLDGFEVSRHLTAEQFVQSLAAHPLDSKPGEKFAYCNSGYNLLGFIIEKVSRRTYWQVLDDRIFKPVKMRTASSRDFPPAANQASGYEKRDGELVARDSNLTDVFAAGAIVSSVTDLVKWNAALDTTALLPRSAWRQIWTPVKLNDGSSYPYGFGWRLDDYDGRKNIGHSGSTAGFSASFQRFPDQRLTVIVLCNLGEQNAATIIARGVAKLAP